MAKSLSGTDYFEYDLFSAYEQGNWLERLFHHRRVREVLALTHFDQKTVLDYGCNTGIFLIRFGQLGVQISGYDVSERNLNRAQKNLLHFGLQSELLCGQLPVRKWDVVLLINVLEYATDKRKVVQDIADHLEPDGRVIVCVANRNHPFVQYAWIRSIFSSRSPSDINRAEAALKLGGRETLELFAQSGFRIERSKWGWFWINQYYVFEYGG